MKIMGAAMQVDRYGCILIMEQFENHT